MPGVYQATRPLDCVGVIGVQGMVGVRMAPSPRARIRSVGPLDRDLYPVGKLDQWWPGKTYGVRPPVCDETPLSAAEVKIAIDKGIVR